MTGQHFQDVLHPAGPLAGRIAQLSWFAFAVATVVWIVTVGALFWAIMAARRRMQDGELAPPDGERRMARGVGVSVAISVVILLVFLGYDLGVGRTLSPVPRAHPLTIEVNGHQWWWEVQYADTAVHDRFTTANEIHVPVGEPVLFVLTAQDVIHSLWVPNLGGKRDLIPGYTMSTWFQADTPGVYRGQCAEFCGVQHAKMALFVVAEPRDQFDRWVTRQRQPASQPTDSVAGHGYQVFMTGTCVMCHSIEGTTAGSHAAPDLTHLASRRTIAAGTLPNSRGNLAGWIVDPQRIKPGSHMPPNMLTPKDLDALLTYLETLK